MQSRDRSKTLTKQLARRAGSPARERAAALILALAMVLGLGACLGQPRPARTPGGPNPALFNREVYRYATSLSPQSAARRYSVVVLQATDARWVPILHHFNHHLKILVYQDIVLSRANDPKGLTLCTTLTLNLVRHPDWFLRGVLGNRITDGDSYLMDVGNAGYQQACASHAIALAKRLGFDGIFLDGVGASLDYELPPGTRPISRPYRTVAAWQAAMYAMLSYAGRAMHAHGLSVVANIGGAVITPGLWQKWNGPLDGAEEEAWTDGKLGLAQQLPFWRLKLANVAWSEAHGKYALLHSWNATEAGNTFGLASMLLVAAGASSYSTSNANDAGYEQWYPDYGVARRLGAPVGPYRLRSNGVYEHRFARGIVLVNPTAHGVGRFSLGGRYSGSGLFRVRTASMGAMSALILNQAK